MQLFAFFHALAHVDEGAHQPGGTAIGAALGDPPAPLAPDPLALPVADALVQLELRHVALKAGSQALVQHGQVFGLGALAPLPDGGGAQRLGFKAENLRQPGVAVQQAGAQIPGPHAHLGNLHGQVDTLLGLLQRLVLGLQGGFALDLLVQQAVEVAHQALQLGRARRHAAGVAVPCAQALHRLGHGLDGPFDAPCQHQGKPPQQKDDGYPGRSAAHGTRAGVFVGCGAGLAKIGHPAGLGNTHPGVEAHHPVQAGRLELPGFARHLARGVPVGLGADGVFAVHVAPQQRAVVIKHTKNAVLGQLVGVQTGVKDVQVEPEPQETARSAVAILHHHAELGQPGCRVASHLHLAHLVARLLAHGYKPGGPGDRGRGGGRWSRAHDLAFGAGEHNLVERPAQALQLFQQAGAGAGVHGLHLGAL